MKLNSKKIMAGLIVATAAAAMLLAIKPQRAIQLQENGKPLVMATVFPIYDIVRNVAGDAVTVRWVLPPGAEPHTFEPAPSNLLDIRKSSVVYAVGHGLDGWLSGMSESTGTPTKIVDDKIRLLPGERDHDSSETPDAVEPDHSGDGYDPHYWLSAGNAAIIAQTVATDLGSRFPDHYELFQANLNDYLDRLASADRDMRRILEPVANRRIATFHGAYRYFAAAYDLELVAEFEPYPGTEPTARYLSDLRDRLKETDTSTLYREPNFNAAAIEVFAEDNGLRLGMLDPLGGTGERDTLINTLLFNANEVAKNQL